MYNLALDEKKKKFIETALEIYKEELEAIASACQSRKLKAGFEQDETDVSNLLYIVRQTPDATMSDASLVMMVKEHIKNNDKIGAIKLVREQRFIGLKEAKDFVDNLQ